MDGFLMDGFLMDVPESTSWMAAREKLGIHSSAHNHQVLAILLGRPLILSPPPDLPYPVSTQSSDPNSLLDLAHAYGRVTRASRASVKLAAKVALFQELIVMCGVGGYRDL
jgi:hypothetical protein